MRYYQNIYAKKNYSHTYLRNFLALYKEEAKINNQKFPNTL